MVRSSEVRRGALTGVASGLALLATLAGCDPKTTGPGNTGGTGTGINFVKYTEAIPWRHSAFGEFQLLEARADVVIANGSFISKDGGRSWRRLNPQLGELFQVSFLDDQSALIHAHGVGYAIYRFDTDLVTPISAPGSGIPAFRSTDNTLYLLGTDRVYRWRGGAWTQKPIGTTFDTFRFAFAAEEGAAPTMYIVTNFDVMVSDDEGATWQRRADRPHLLSAPVRLVAPAGGGMIITAEHERNALLTMDGGRTFTPITYPGDEKGGHLRVGDDGALYLRLHRSRDGGATWERFLDHAAYGVENHTRDVARYTRGRFYVNLRHQGFFRTSDPMGRLEYAGGFEAPVYTIPPPHLGALNGAPLAGGDALIGLARYDASTLTWIWHTEGLHGEAQINRLRDGRLAAQNGRVVRFSSDEGRTWGPPRAIWAAPPATWEIYHIRQAGPIVQTQDGKLYASGYWQHCPFSGGGCNPMGSLAVSGDGGVTWSQAAIVGNHESPFSVWALAASGNVLYTYERRSRDGGRTWEPSPARTPLGALSTGEILFTNDASDRHILRLLERDGTTTRVLGPMTVEGQATDGRGIDYAGALFSMGADDRAYVFCGTHVCRTELPIR